MYLITIAAIILLASCNKSEQIVARISGENRLVLVINKAKKSTTGDTIQIVRQKLNGETISRWTISAFAWGNKTFTDSVRGGIMETEYRLAIVQ